LLFGGLNLQSYCKPKLQRLQIADSYDNSKVSFLVDEASERLKKVKEVIKTRAEEK